MVRWIAGAALLFASVAAQAAIKEEPVTYKDGATTLKGFLVYDDAKKGPRPGMILAHEWWGITKHMHNEARRFARQGYSVLIADLYGEAKTADNPKDAGALMKSLLGDPAVVKSRFDAARKELAGHAGVDGKRIAASGYCMGGTVVLNMASAGEDLAAVAAFHPSLGGYKPASGPVKAKVVVLNGADDPFNKPEAIDAFKKDMEKAKADYKFVNYPGAVHAFTNPEATAAGKKFNIPLAYNAKVDKDAKAEADKAFAAALKK
jgi:dienelactone hydrolase